jgi:hypothetical protein
MTVTITFDVPEECRELFGHEVDLLLYQAEPVAAWLERHGGGMRMEGSTA